MLTVQLTTEPNGAICLASPYDRDFVEGLKLAIPYKSRAWDASRKRWTITPECEPELFDFCEQMQVKVLDHRNGGQAVRPADSQAPTVAIPPMPDDLRQAFDGLHLQYTAPLCVANAAYKALSGFYHPDHGGNPEDFHRVADAITTIRSYLDPKPEETDSDIPF